jgi:hypothetical protein
MGRKVNLNGQTFTYLTVLSEVEERRNDKIFWNCLCKCGKQLQVTTQALKFGGTKSCGCYKAEITGIRNSTHGKTSTKTYVSWAAMKQRCYYTSHIDYPRYGGRGIKISKLWLDDYQNFLDDMGEVPEGHTLDRIDPDSDYSKENCRWLDKSLQSRNTRRQRRQGVGITWHSNRFEVRLGGLYISSHKLYEDALKARDDAELKHWGFITPKADDGLHYEDEK